MSLHALCVFGNVVNEDGKTAVDQLRDLLNNPEYAGPGTLLRFSRDGEHFVMNVINADGDDPGGINQSSQCPGAPGCP